MEDRILIGFYADDDLKQRLQRQAQLEDRSMSNLLRRIIEQYLAQTNSNGSDNGKGKS